VAASRACRSRDKISEIRGQKNTPATSRRQGIHANWINPVR
jgi:hypothetical protein